MGSTPRKGSSTYVSNESSTAAKQNLSVTESAFIKQEIESNRGDENEIGRDTARASFTSLKRIPAAAEFSEIKVKKQKSVSWGEELVTIHLLDSPIASFSLSAEEEEEHEQEVKAKIGMEKELEDDHEVVEEEHNNGQDYSVFHNNLQHTRNYGNQNKGSWIVSNRPVRSASPPFSLEHVHSSLSNLSEREASTERRLPLNTSLISVKMEENAEEAPKATAFSKHLSSSSFTSSQIVLQKQIYSQLLPTKKGIGSNNNSNNNSPDEALFDSKIDSEKSVWRLVGSNNNTSESENESTGSGTDRSASADTFSLSLEKQIQSMPLYLSSPVTQRIAKGSIETPHGSNDKPIHQDQIQLHVDGHDGHDGRDGREPGGTEEVLTTPLKLTSVDYIPEVDDKVDDNEELSLRSLMSLTTESYAHSSAASHFNISQALRTYLSPPYSTLFFPGMTPSSSPTSFIPTIFNLATLSFASVLAH